MLTRSEAVIAAQELDTRFLAPSKVAPEQSPRGVGVAHMRWMVEQMVTGQPATKTQRWLGYIQGMLVASGVATLDQMKDINARADAAG